MNWFACHPWGLVGTQPISAHGSWEAISAVWRRAFGSHRRFIWRRRQSYTARAQLWGIVQCCWTLVYKPAQSPAYAAAGSISKVESKSGSHALLVKRYQALQAKQPSQDLNLFSGHDIGKYAFLYILQSGEKGTDVRILARIARKTYYAVPFLLPDLSLARSCRQSQAALLIYPLHSRRILQNP